MNILYIPWLELAIGFAVIGSLVVSRLREPFRANRWGLVFIGLSFACSFLAWLAFYVGVTPEQSLPWSPQPWLFGATIFSLDELSTRSCRRWPCSTS